MTNTPIVFLHISDIHFRQKKKPFDLDESVRSAFEQDVKVQTKTFSRVDAILLGGDIGFSGAEVEYEMATAWLGKLCGIISCDVENIWMVPGNHDVDQDYIEKSKILRNFRQELRSVPHNKIDSVFESWQDDLLFKDIQYKPFTSYNIFAAKFQCNLSPDSLYWETDFGLNDGTILRVRGINSAIISGKGDDNESKKLVVTSFQTQFSADPHVTYVVLCHHPPDWIRDYDRFEKDLIARASLQLFGHKHDLTIRKVDESVRIGAGAFHPSRSEAPWVPSYNFIELLVNYSEDGTRNLLVKVHKRVWNHDERKFDFSADCAQNGFIVKTVKLRNVERPLAAVDVSELKTVESTSISSTMVSHNSEESPVSRRKLLYKFLSLPFPDAVDIATHLKLLVDEDRGVDDTTKGIIWFNRAESMGLIAELDDLVTKINALK